jgi:hypothetical protein
MGDQLAARPLPTQDSTLQKSEETIHALSGIRFHSPIVKAVETHTPCNTAPLWSAIVTIE